MHNKFIASRTNMFNETTFQEILLLSLGEYIKTHYDEATLVEIRRPNDGRSISRNVASLNILVYVCGKINAFEIDIYHVS